MKSMGGHAALAMTNQTMPDLVVGYGCTIEGTVHSHGTVLIHGCVKGHIHAHTVVCSQTGEVLGHIACDRLDIAGQLNGSFDVTEAVIREGAFVNTFEEAVCTGTCQIAGAVSGTLRTAQLQLEATARLNGQLVANPSSVNPLHPGTAS